MARIGHDWLVDWFIGLVSEAVEIRIQGSGKKKTIKNISLSEKDLDAV